MSEIAIRADRVGKRYRVGQLGDGLNFREAVTHVLSSPVRALRFVRRGRDESRDEAAEQRHVWAIRDVSFEVRPGQVVGIIGHNGAGKSSLLKILSRITEPTEGEVEIHGRVGSLLEVGTGFHPELTGRENILLNGAILGMPKKEIARKFDEMVAFAEVERFIDTPVKRYSSGMYTRLAFAVAAHLEPEILLVDEVLAVGDASFQKKCLGKMGDVAREGRTILFVSHNTHAVAVLCPQTILMQSGRLVDFGPTPKVIGRYLATEGARVAEAEWPFEDAPGTDTVRLRSVRALNPQGASTFHMDIDQPIALEMEFWMLRRSRMTPSFHVTNQHGVLLFALGNMHDPEWGPKEYEPGLYQCRVVIPGSFLNEGQHYVTIFLTRDSNAARIDVHRGEAISFQVDDTGAARGDFVQPWSGLIRPVLPWNMQRAGDLPRL